MKKTNVLVIVIVVICAIGAVVFYLDFRKPTIGGRLGVELYHDRYGNLLESEPKLMATYSEGLKASLGSNNKYGYVDIEDNLVIDHKYNEAREFSDGLAVVSLGRGYLYINKKGNLVLEGPYTKAKSFSEGLAAVSESPYIWRYISKDGQQAISEKFREAYDFKDGKARVRDFSGLLKIIDREGNELQRFE